MLLAELPGLLAELLGLLAVLLGLLAGADLGHEDGEHEGHNELLGLLAVLLGLLADADLGYKDGEHEGHNELQAAGGLHDHDRSSEGEAGGPPHEGCSPYHSI